jgi:branched-subunit amino acid aminotransferase/4-amino-4-deoxychorismate lyase
MARGSAGQRFLCWRWDSGEIVPLRAGIPPQDRGFRYGQHLFESVAVLGGRVLLAGEHLALLVQAASRNGFPIPKGLRSSLRRFLSEKASLLPDGMVRIYLTAGTGGPADPVKSPSCFLTWEETSFPSLPNLERGFSLVTVPGKTGLGWGEKSGNYLAHCEALRVARSMGADEALVMDDLGRPVSCAMGNLIVWLPGASYRLPITPARQSGARSGAVAGWLVKAGRVQEKDLTVRDLSKAVAMAVTNSRIGVMPVASLDGRELPDLSLPLELSDFYRKKLLRP